MEKFGKIFWKDEKKYTGARQSQHLSTTQGNTGLYRRVMYYFVQLMGCWLSRISLLT